MKVGLDLHGVIDAIPEFLSIVTRLLVDEGHEVHVITGQKYDSQLRDELNKRGIRFTHVFSVASHLIEQGYSPKWDEKGTPWFDETEWRRAKGDYCAEKGIDIHIDDSGTYHRFFPKGTKYVRMGLMEARDNA